MPDKTELLIAGLVDDLSAVAPLRKRGGMALAVTALAAGAAGMIGLCGLRTDLQAGQPAPMVLIAAGLLLVLALASCWAVVDMARPYVGVRREGWGWTALMAGVLPGAALILLTMDWFHGAPPALDGDGWKCLAAGLGWGLLTAGGLIMWLRRGAPLRPERAGLLTGVGAGAGRRRASR